MKFVVIKPAIMRVKLLLIPFFINFFYVKSQNLHMESKISGGKKSDIKKYPHSVFMFLIIDGEALICGASVVNQKIITAAHCIASCMYNKCKVDVFAGNTNRFEGNKFKVHGFKTHEKFNINDLVNDICLIRLKEELPLGTSIKRVAILRKPPLRKIAVVAGWGYLDEDEFIASDCLQHVKQDIWTRSHCQQILSDVPKGCICAGKENSKSYPAIGDSGSALMIDGYIQIGIVSFKEPEISSSLVVYTDVTYFYKWIRNRVKGLMCLE